MRIYEGETMRYAAVILVVFLIFGTIALDSGIQKEKVEEVMVVYYFGATNIGFCMVPDNIRKIKKIKADYPAKYENSTIKFVMVCVDENIDEGLKFIKKYGYWDEISIGKFYKNELAQFTLNRISTPDLPHILVFKDQLSFGKWNLPIVKRRDLLVDLAGGERINEWIEKGYPVPFRKNSTEENENVIFTH